MAEGNPGDKKTQRSTKKVVHRKSKGKGNRLGGHRENGGPKNGASVNKKVPKHK